MLEPELTARALTVVGPAAVALEVARRRRARRRLWPTELRISDPPRAPEGVFRIGRYLPDRGEECVWAPWDGGEQHLAAFGTTNAGKTSLARVLIVEAAELWGWDVQVADGKGGVDFTWVRDAGLGLVCTRGAIPTLLREVATEITRRAELLVDIRVERDASDGTPRAVTPANLRELRPAERREHGLRPRLVVIDELAMLLATEDRKSRPISGPLLEIAAAGRFVGIHLAVLMQRGDANLLSGFVGNLLQARVLIGATSQVAEHMAHGAEAMAVMETAAEARGENVSDLERSMRPAGRAVVSGLANRPAGLAHLYLFRAVDRAPAWHEWMATRATSTDAPASAEPELEDTAGAESGARTGAGSVHAASDSRGTLPAERRSGTGERGRRTPSPRRCAHPSSAPPGPRLRHRLRLRAGALALVVRPLVSDPPRDPTLRARVLERDGGLCASCGTVSEGWHADHRIPLSRGGRDELANAQTLCAPCHAFKTAAEARVRALSRRMRRRAVPRVPWRELRRPGPRAGIAAGVLFALGLITSRWTMPAAIVLAVLAFGPDLARHYLVPAPFRHRFARRRGGLDGLTYLERADTEREKRMPGVLGVAANVADAGRLTKARLYVVALCVPAVYLAGVIVRAVMT